MVFGSSLAADGSQPDKWPALGPCAGPPGSAKEHRPGLVAPEVPLNGPLVGYPAAGPSAGPRGGSRWVASTARRMSSETAGRHMTVRAGMPRRLTWVERVQRSMAATADCSVQ
jgi:hypothetical protein